MKIESLSKKSIDNTKIKDALLNFYLELNNSVVPENETQKQDLKTLSDFYSKLSSLSYFMLIFKQGSAKEIEAVLADESLEYDSYIAFLTEYNNVKSNKAMQKLGKTYLPKYANCSNFKEIYNKHYSALRSKSLKQQFNAKFMSVFKDYADEILANRTTL